MIVLRDIVIKWLHAMGVVAATVFNLRTIQTTFSHYFRDNLLKRIKRYFSKNYIYFLWPLIVYWHNWLQRIFAHIKGNLLFIYIITFINYILRVWSNNLINSDF